MARELKLGLNIGYWAGGPPPDARASIQEAERLGFDSVWTAEAYGSDALLPLAWWGASTEADQARHRDRPDLRPHPGGHGDGRDDARPPVGRTTDPRAWRVGTAGGRGLVRPVVRQAAGADARVHRDPQGHLGAARARSANEGPHYPLPFGDGTGLGKPLKSSIHPLREDIPIYLAAEGPKNIAMAAELCDGWLASFYSPHHEDLYRERAGGRVRAAGRAARSRASSRSPQPCL